MLFKDLRVGKIYSSIDSRGEAYCKVLFKGKGWAIIFIFDCDDNTGEVITWESDDANFKEFNELFGDEARNVNNMFKSLSFNDYEIFTNNNEAK